MRGRGLWLLQFEKTDGYAVTNPISPATRVKLRNSLGHIAQALC